MGFNQASKLLKCNGCLWCNSHHPPCITGKVAIGAQLGAMSNVRDKGRFTAIGGITITVIEPASMVA
jgi:hypothetical protein